MDTDPFSDFLARDKERRAQDDPLVKQGRAQTRVAPAAKVDQTAEAAAIAKRYGVPPAVVQLDLDNWRERRAEDDAQKIIDGSPQLGKWLGQGTNAAVAKDDLATLSKSERIFAEKNGYTLFPAQDLLDATPAEKAFYAERGFLPYRRGENQGEFYERLTQFERQNKIPGARAKATSTFEIYANEGRRVVRNVPRALQREGARVMSGLADAGRAYADLQEKYDVTKGLQQYLFGGTIYDPFQKGLKDAAGNQIDVQRRLTQEMGPLSDVEEAVYSGIGSAGSSIAALLVGTVGRRPDLGLGLLGASTAGNSYRRGRDEGLSVERAALFGLVDGAIEIGTERVPLLNFIADTKVGTPVFRRLVNNMAQEQIGEQAATALQDLNAWANIEVNQGKTFSDYLRERPDAALQTAISTFVATSATNAVFAGFEQANQRFRQNVRGVENAQRAAELTTQVQEIAQMSKLRERDVSSFESWVAQAAEGTDAESVYIEANQLVQVLEQSGLSQEQIIEALPSLRETLAPAMLANTDVEIPMAEFAARAGDLGAALVPHLRIDPADPSQKEAELYMQGAQEALQADVERVLQEGQATDETRASAARVQDGVLQQLNAAGRFTPDVNTAYAALHASFFTKLAADLGVTPEEAAARYPLKIQAEGATGETVLDQNAPRTTINVGLNIGDGQTKLDPVDVVAALRALGVDVARSDVRQSATEPTLVADLSRALTPEEAYALSEQLQQDAIAQRTGEEGGLFGPKAEAWGEFNPDFFLELDDNGRGSSSEDSGKYAPLDGAPSNFSGPIPHLVDAAEAYAKSVGIDLKRQQRLVAADTLDTKFAERLADAFEAMEHNPSDPKVAGAYAEMIAQTRAQYDALVAQGVSFTFFDDATDPYAGNPFSALRDLRDNKTMAVYSTLAGYGSGVSEVELADNPMLADTELVWLDQNGNEVPVLANDLFRAVHDAFGHGLEGVGFRAHGEENAWQAHQRLFTGAAVAAITSETRGQNSWLNFGPYGDKNRDALLEDTTFADQKIGLLPEWAWTQNVIGDQDGATYDQSPIDVASQVPGLSHVLPYLTPEEQARVKKRSAETLMDIFTNLPDAEEMAAVAYSGRAKKGWYERSSQALIEVFGIEDAPRFAALLAALSPQTSVESNTVNALSTWVSWDRAGRPTDRAAIIDVLANSVQGGKGLGSVLNSWIDNTVRALAAPNPMQLDLSGPKVNSFFLNLVGVLDEVTNDTWMANYALMSQTIFWARRDPKTKIGVKSPGYLAMNALVRRAAEIATERTGQQWTAAEIQETVWSWTKALTEKTFGSAREATDILEMGGLTEQDIANQPDFALLFVSGFYRKFLIDAGYGKEIEALERSERAARPSTGEGSVTSPEGSGFDPERFAEHLANAASRIDTRVDRRKSKGSAQGDLFDTTATVYNQDARPDPLVAFRRESLYPTVAVRHADGTVYTDEGARYPDRLATIASAIGAKAVVAVEAGDPRLSEGVPVWHTEPPVNSDGTITIEHWGPEGVTKTDPTRWGESGTAPRSEQQSIADPSHMRRTYFGIASGQPGGYIIEFPGRTRYEARVPADRLYHVAKDPKGFKRGDGITKLEKRIKDAGYLGYWTNNGQLGLVATVFEPVEVTPVAESYQQDALFYSALERAIESTTTKKAPAQQWIATLQKTPGVKQEELAWTGLLDFLADVEGPVTREQLLEVVREGGLQVDEVVLGTDDFGDAQPTQFSEWTTDRVNATYRELLITLPVGAQGNPARAPSTHWDVEGVVAHLRFMGKTGPNGEKILFIEEVQSDWHQKGRDKGYQTPPKDLAAARQAAVEASREWTLLYGQGLELGMPTGTTAPIHYLRAIGTPEALALADKMEPVGLRVAETQMAKKQAEGGGIPNAPFKTTWPALVMKRAIRWAADNGYQKIAWTTGEQQAERYDLSEAVGIIDITRRTLRAGEGATYDMTFQTYGAQSALVDNLGGGPYTEEEIASLLGGDLAKRAVAAADDMAESSGGLDRAAQIDGDDLQVGGEGMKAFYDRNLVNITNNLVKKYGTKVGVVQVDFDSQRAAILRTNVRNGYAAEESQRQLDIMAADAQQWGFDITPELADAAMGGFPLFQKTGAPRGQIAFGADMQRQPSVLSLLRGADLSTFLHETGHYFLEIMADVASQPGAPDRITKDLQTFFEWSGVGSLAEWRAMPPAQKREHHERFARGFEAYLYEGKAPSEEARGMFSRFRSWLLTVYKSLAQLNVELTDEVRGVFDRMLASDAEIAEAEAMAQFAPETEVPDGVDPTEWAEYQRLGGEATAQATNELEQRSLRDMKFAGRAAGRALKQYQAQVAEKRARMVEEVRGDLLREPVFRAGQYIRRAELDGQPVDGPTKILIAEVDALYEGEPDIDAADIKKRLGYGKYGALSKDGVHPAQLAEMFGFTSADHLIQELLLSPSLDDAVETETDVRMLERYGDLSSPQAVQDAVNSAIHNDVRGRFLAAGYAALAKAPGQARVLASAAKALAEQTIARTKVRDVRPSKYEAAERRAGKASAEAAAKNNLIEAATQKRNQLINFYGAKASREALDDTRSIVDYLKKFDKTTVRKNLDYAYVEQVDRLLERFDLRIGTTNKAADRRKSLAEWVDRQREMGFDPVIDEALLDEARRTPWRELTVEELRGLRDTVKNIEHLARLKKKLLTAKDKREFEATAGAMADAIRDNSYQSVPVIMGSKTWTERFKAGVGDFFAMHRKLANLVYVMDGNKYGAVWDNFIRPMNAAGDAEAVANEKATIRMGEIFARLSGDKLTKRQYVPEINASISLEDRLMFALNIGNAGNRQRLMDGDRLDDAALDAVLAPLTAEHWQFVQEVWDFIDSYWPQIRSKELRVSGVPPEKVDAVPFERTLANGETVRLDGGYFPIKYDPDRSSKAEADEASAVLRQMMQGAYTNAQTRRGHTKARAEEVDRALRKDFGVIFEHTAQVIHDLSWHEYLIDANRLLRESGIDGAIREGYGPNALRWMRKALEDIAVGDLGAQNVAERAMNHLRAGVSIAGLGWNLWTSLLQPIGLTQSMSRIGTQWVGKGLMRLVGDAAKLENAASWVYERSDFMRLRAKTMQREINEIRNQVSAKSPVRTAVEAVVPQPVAQAVADSYFILIAKAQLVADLPTWIGQYEKSMAAGADESDAAAQADQAVIDSQGGGQIKDLAGIQRGSPLLKLWTNFYSYFNVTYNLLADRTANMRRVGHADLPYFAADVLMLTVLPSTLATIMYQLLKGGDDWEEELPQKIAGDNVSYMLGLMVGMREIGAALTGDAGYRGPAGARFFGELSTLGKQVSQGEVDEAAVRATNSTAGIILHYPAGQVDRAVRGTQALAEGEAGVLAPLVGPPPKN